MFLFSFNIAKNILRQISTYNKGWAGSTSWKLPRLKLSDRFE